MIARQMAESIRTLKAQGVTVLLAEQSLRFAHTVADQAIVIEKGRVRFAGGMDELAQHQDLGRTYLAV